METPFRVNAWVPPEHSPRSTWELGRGRITFTETRYFTTAAKALEFVANVETAGQLDMLRGMVILPPRTKHIELDNCTPLSERAFHAEEREPNRKPSWY